MLIYCTLLRADPDLGKKMRPRDPQLCFFNFFYLLSWHLWVFKVQKAYILHTPFPGVSEHLKQTTMEKMRGLWNHSTSTGTYVLVSPVLFLGDCPDEHGGVQVGRQLAAGPQVPHRGSSGCSGRGSTTSTTFLPTSVADPWNFGTDSDADPYLWLMDPDADPGGPKTYGSYGSGSATLLPISAKGDGN